jgi:drug/metabolite transporter (DMT)-like permease
MPIAPAQTRTSQSSIWLGMLVLYVVWGSTYLGIAIAVETIPPFIMGGTRFFIAGVILLAWSFVRGGGSIPMPSRRQFRDSFIVGSLLLGAGMGLVAFGETLVPSGITALLIAMMPVWVAILGRIFFAERLPALAIVGIVVGFVGVTILAGPSVFGSTDALDPIGLAAIIISPIAWATGSLYASHRAVLPSQPLVATGIQMFCGGAILWVVGALSGEFGRFDITGVSSASLLAVVYLTLIGSLLAFTAYGWLLRVAPLPLVATYAYVNPVVAVLLGAFVLHEAIEPRTLVAGTVIVAAVALIVTARGRMQAPRPSPAADVIEASSPTTSATARATTR